jgi:hypothetical protein
MNKLILITLCVLATFTSRAQTVHALADSSFAHHDYVKAYDYYTDDLKQNPNSLTDLRHAGFCLMNCEGQELNSSRFWVEALKIAPNDPVSNYYLGVVYMDAAKKETDIDRKANFKALAQIRLLKAQRYGSAEAKAAIKDLNSI